MAGRRTNPEQRAKFMTLVSQGWLPAQAAEKCGFSERTGFRILADNGIQISNDREEAAPAGAEYEPRIQRPPARIVDRALLKHELSDVARDCLTDFGRFRARYFGRYSSPWQEYAAEQVVHHLSTLEKSFLVINMAPGAGKSTTFAHDIPAWITCRNRSIRGFIGSSTLNIARTYTSYLRDTFERVVPEEADEEALRLGLGQDAVATLAEDYGRFKPLASQGAATPPWAGDRFTVVQPGQTPVGTKETSWSAWGWDSNFIGWRVNFIIWDDLVTPDNAVMPLEGRDKMRAKWRNTAERRLEPGGLLLLQGQRLGPEDLYKYCIDMEIPDFDEHNIVDLGMDPGNLPYVKKYVHIVLPAHMEENCRVDEDPKMHLLSAPPYDPRDPENSGCLLDPRRVSWREQLGIMAEDSKTYATVYQQKDSDPTSVLIPEIWIEGGEDAQGTYPGCWDLERNPGELPDIPAGARTHRCVSVDPSPANYWAIQDWLYVEPEERPANMGDRVLVDELRVKMRADEFLDYTVRKKAYEGLMVDWVDRAKRQGQPITYLVFEKNAAQKFVMQYSWFRDFLFQRNIQLMGHVTGLNKGDPKLGIDTLRTHYMFGRKRFPGTPAGKRACRQHVYELTHHPDTATEDTVMADWFFEFHLPQFRDILSSLPDIYANVRPSFMEPA